MRTVKHTWANPSLETVRSGIIDLGKDLKPMAREKVGTAVARMKSCARGIATKATSFVDATGKFSSSLMAGKSSAGSRDAHSPKKDAELDWAPEPNALSAGSKHGENRQGRNKIVSRRRREARVPKVLEGPGGKEHGSARESIVESSFPHRKAKLAMRKIEKVESIDSISDSVQEELDELGASQAHKRQGMEGQTDTREK